MLAPHPVGTTENTVDWRWRLSRRQYRRTPAFMAMAGHSVATRGWDFHRAPLTRALLTRSALSVGDRPASAA